MTWPPPEKPRRQGGGIPSQLKKLNERIDELERSLKAVTSKADAAFEVASKVASKK
jgi:outer membrane murein-binding lipoprotein Lpp